MKRLLSYFPNPISKKSIVKQQVNMKQKLNIFLYILFLGVFANAQDAKFSATLGYPIAVGDNFLEQYSSIVDVGAQYRFLETGPINIGISTNAGFFNRSTTLGSVTIKDRLVLIQPRVFGEVDTDALIGFRPFIGLGYSILASKFTSNSNQTEDTSESTGGININLGTAYDISNRFFVFVSFDYLNVSRDNPNIDNSFFKKANILKLGGGFRF